MHNLEYFFFVHGGEIAASPVISASTDQCAPGIRVPIPTFQVAPFDTSRYVFPVNMDPEDPNVEPKIFFIFLRLFLQHSA